MTDTFRAHRRLIAAGLSEEQAKTFLRLLTSAEAGHFDRQATRGLLLDGNYTPSQAALLIGELLQVIASRASGPS